MILVTGATGLLGSRLLFDLVSKGNHVRALRRETSRMTCLNHYFSSRPDLMEKIEWVTGNVTDIFSLENALDGINQVYHCAARVSFQPSDRLVMQHTNIEGTANVVNLCLEKGINKLAYVSSIAALGRSENEGIIDEAATWKSTGLN